MAFQDKWHPEFILYLAFQDKWHHTVCSYTDENVMRNAMK